MPNFISKRHCFTTDHKASNFKYFLFKNSIHIIPLKDSFWADSLLFYMVKCRIIFAEELIYNILFFNLGILQKIR